MPKRRKSHIYPRARSGVTRYWADFRDFSDVGGGREPLTAPGEKLATTDRTVGEVLVARRLEELEAHRRGRAIHGVLKQASLGAFASEHLIARKKAGRVTDDTIMAAQLHLERAIEYLGANRELGTVTVSEVREWLAHLQTVPQRGDRNTRRGKPLSPWSARHHLNALSNLYRRAGSEGYVPPGFNPAAAVMEKPRASRKEERWLEVFEAALLLEAARRYGRRRGDSSMPFGYELIATFLLTGGRFSEVVSLAVEDISFDRKTVTFRPNEWGRVKTETSYRTIPLWPQLEAILRPYVFGADRAPGRLLFPSQRTARRDMREDTITDCRKLLDAIGVWAGWKRGEIRTKMFRHSYCAARLQTTDGGAPVSIYTVSRELGHGSTSMVERVYSHLGQVRHRSEHVEYRIDQHVERLTDRLAALEGKP